MIASKLKPEYAACYVGSDMGALVAGSATSKWSIPRLPDTTTIDFGRVLSSRILFPLGQMEVLNFLEKHSHKESVRLYCRVYGRRRDRYRYCVEGIEMDGRRLLEPELYMVGMTHKLPMLVEF
jgi:hypothetical protein